VQRWPRKLQLLLFERDEKTGLKGPVFLWQTALCVIMSRYSTTYGLPISGRADCYLSADEIKTTSPDRLKTFGSLNYDKPANKMHSR
jgi:hypothetical protein